MILQSGKENIIYGSAPEFSQVTLVITGGTEKHLSAVSDENGKWQLAIPPFPSSFNAFAFEFFCENETISFNDILFGELYHISGQSNMELPLNRTIDPLNEVIPDESRFIREFRVPVKCCFGKNEEYDDFLGGEWKTAEGEDLLEMSAAGYYFAEEIFQKYNVPVGLVNTSAGGSPVEARLPYETLLRLGGYEDFLTRCTVPDYEKNTAEADRKKYAEWCAGLDRADSISQNIFHTETGFTKCRIPFYFRDDLALNGFCGRIWFRRKFEIPEGADLENAMLILGAMIDADKVYINGVQTGETGYMYPPRNYPVSKNLLQIGTNTVHVLLEVRQGQGGFVKGKNYCLKLSDRIIDLSGEWEYCIAAKGEYITPDVFFQGLPLSMYAALTAPTFRIKFRGLLWYQGESNDRNPERYFELFKIFVNMYRSRCDYEIPVIFTQLCNFDDPVQSVPPMSWAMVREQQLKCLEIHNTAMAVTIDIGEANDLHPMNKRDVGRRLALCARRLIYDDSSVPEDIVCLSARNVIPGRVLLKFSDNALLRLKNETAKHFELIFEDGSVIIPKAEKTSIGIILTFNGENTPVSVRYAWSNDPENPDLFTSEGLPISPFRRDIMRLAAINEFFLDNRIYTKIYRPDSRGNNCAVILSHGYNCCHEDVEDIARALAERGYFACTFDFCGGSVKSKSVGKTIQMSVSSEIEELNKMIGFVRTASGAKKLFLYGESQGGLVSALAACQNNVDGMALLYPAFCIPENWNNMSEDKMKKPFEFMGMTISRCFYDGVPKYDVYDRISSCGTPVLIIHGRDDRVVDLKFAKRAAECFPNAVLKLYDGEGHGFSPKARRCEISDITDFFDRCGGNL